MGKSGSVSHLWGNCSFLLDPGAYQVLFVPTKSLFPQSYVSSGGSVVGLMARAFPRGPNTPDQDALGNLVCPLQSTREPKSPQDEWRARPPPSLCPLPEAEPGCTYSTGCNGLRRSAAKRSYPSPKFRRRPREATPCPRSGAVAERSNPTSKEWWLRGRRRAERSYSTFKVRRAAVRRNPTSKVRSGGREEQPHVQGKEQRLHFAGAAVKRYPTSMVRETQVRRWVLREGIRGQTH